MNKGRRKGKVRRILYMGRRDEVSGMNRVSWTPKKWLVAGEFFISYLRIRKDTQGRAT